ncbi:uracil-DNA glycosylase [Thermochromatium tepidum]|nr:uracil-DNA glycosylase [Thermochromatium tepidum]
MSKRPLEEWRRRAYLEAMGVSLWERRAPSFASPKAIEAKPVLIAHTETVDPIERMDWDALEAAVRDCHACRLWETRTKTVFGVGDRHADLMVIGEAPGADEDSQGEPFVGRAGQLLNRMLAAIGFSREQVYIANVLKCRPPGNRDPRPDEVLACQAYLQRQVALIEPRVILSVGRVSAQYLLKTDTPVGRLRGRWFEHGPTHIPVRVTYHPAYLLRSPEQKARVWDDLTEVRRWLWPC